MKCVCGYEYERKWDNGEREFVVTKGDEPFDSTTNTYTIDIADPSPYCDQTYQSTFYICPKCRTVRAARW